MSQRAESMQGSHCRDERLAWVASRWQGTSCSSSCVSKVLGANCKRANNFHPVAVDGAAGGVVVKGSAQDQKVASSSATSGRVEKQKTLQSVLSSTHKK